MDTDQPHSQEFFPRLSPEISTQLATRVRVRLETALYSKDEIAGVLRVTVARNATPTAYEKQWVWGHAHLALTNGIFIRYLHVAEASRGQGFGSHLLYEATKLGRTLGMHVHINTPAANTRTRMFLRANGFSESIFWYTPKKLLMVRYMQMP